MPRGSYCIDDLSEAAVSLPRDEKVLSLSAICRSLRRQEAWPSTAVIMKHREIHATYTFGSNPDGNMWVMLLEAVRSPTRLQ